jgi:CMP-N,N'-diacetyllegionaminic acid synthase
MIRDHHVCAIVPARGGSKGIPRKNLYELEGISLVERSVRLARRCRAVDRVLVSTDDPEITALADRLGAATPVPRPAAFASDGARTIDVIRNLVDDKVLDRGDCLLLLQPTTPLRSLADLDVACAMMEQRWDSADAIVSVCAVDGPHPYKAQIVRDSYLAPLLGTDSAVPRQSLPAVCLPNGALYLAKIATLLDEDTFLPKRTLPYAMQAIPSINLDNPLDLVLLEAVVAKGLATGALADSGF